MWDAGYSICVADLARRLALLSASYEAYRRLPIWKRSFFSSSVSEA